MSVLIQSSVPAAALTQQGARHLFRMSNGDLLALWINNTTSNGLQYAISQNTGSTWTAPATISGSLPTDLSASAFTQNGDTLYGAVGESGANNVTPLVIPYTAASHVIGIVTVGTAVSRGSVCGGLSADYDSANSCFHVLSTPVGFGTKLYAFAFTTSAALIGSGTNLNQSVGAASCSITAVSGSKVYVTWTVGAGNTLEIFSYTYSSGSYTYTASTTYSIASGTIVTAQAALDGSQLLYLANGNGTIYAFRVTTSTNTLLSVTTVASGLGTSGDGSQPSAMALPSGDIVVAYQSNQSQSNGEIYQTRRVGGVWQSATRVAGGATTGWQQPSLCTSVGAGVTSVPVLYVTGTGTLALQSDSVALTTAPNTPAGLTPGGGATVNPASPGSFSFIYTNPTSTDAMSAYQAQIYRASDNALIWDSGQTNGTCASGSTFTFAPGTTLVAGVGYYWQVKAWDQGATASAYSTHAAFTAGQAATVTTTAPTGTVTSSTLTAAWSFADPQGYAQQSYQVQLLDTDDATVLYDSGTVATSGARTAPLPYAYVTAHTYHVRVRATSATSGLTSAWSDLSFTTAFTAPDLPASFSATPISDVRGTRMLLQWDDYRKSGRDFAPATAPYQGNWLAVAHMESPESWGITNNGLGNAAAVALGGGTPVEGSSLLAMTATPIANPLTAPTLAQAAGTSAFTAGQVVYVAYAYRTGAGGTVGTTLISPTSTITIATNGNQVNVTVPALPASAASVTLYVNTSSGLTPLGAGPSSNTVSSIAVTAFASVSGVPGSNTTIVGSFSAVTTLPAAVSAATFGDGVTPVGVGDDLSCMVYCTDWSQFNAAASVMWLLTNAGPYGIGFNAATETSAMPTSGSGWWEARLRLTGAAITTIPAGWKITGIQIDFSCLGTSTSVVTLYADDMRLVRYAGQTCRQYGSGTNLLASTVSAGVATVTDTTQAWQAGQFATPVSPATPYLVADSGGYYWSISQNTPTTLTVAPLQSQPAFPVGAFAIWRADFLEATDNRNPSVPSTWRLFANEAGETGSADKYTYGQLLGGSGNTAVAVCQSLGRVTDVACQVQEVGGGGGATGPANSASRGIIVRLVDLSNYWVLGFNGATNVWQLVSIIANTATVVATGTFAVTGQAQYIRASVNGNAVYAGASADGVTWAGLTQVGTITGGMATSSGYVGLFTFGIARFDRFWVSRTPSVGWPSSTDPLSADLQRTTTAAVNQPPYQRVAAALTSPPGQYIDWHVAVNVGYQYRLVVNGAGGTTAQTP